MKAAPLRQRWALIQQVQRAKIGTGPAGREDELIPMNIPMNGDRGLMDDESTLCCVEKVASQMLTWKFGENYGGQM